ncbi:hypothetical protein [Fimbriiglobus ruber]|uniref:hypothetical protein n=1 Tax=Fimbriiglobus ruber TaxID=1908690 RepID=UPI00117B4523|nr:hypothetical protein [Fimbriiglobus ruber]
MLRKIRAVLLKNPARAAEYFKFQWEFIMKNYGDKYKDGFKVKAGEGYHYALTAEGLKKAAPKVVGATADVVNSLPKEAPAELKAAEDAAKAKWPGKVVKVMKVGGRILVAVAIVADAYEIYEANFAAKKIVSVAGGWAGAMGGAWAGGKVGTFGGGAVGSLFAGVGAPIGAAVGGTVGAISGGVGGYFIGREITEIVFEWVFAK